VAPASPPASSAAVPTTSAAPAPESSSAAPGNTCKLGQLSIQGVRGGAFQGREIAGVLFTNASARPCTVSGYPSAQLVRNGKALGRPANDNPGPVHTILLKPGQMAQAELTAVTTCQAPLSDAVRVSLPGQSDTADASMQLRACSLSVNPLQRP
jgi:hypothetical protein